MAKLAAVLTVMALAMAVSNAEEDAVKAMTTAPRRSSRFLDEIIMGNGGRSKRCRPHLHICDKDDVIGYLKSRCCDFHCTNVLTDRNNCGGCLTVCSFGFQCCNGRCLNVAYDKNHCGRCNVRCNKGQRCVYGMCAYG
ncbi:hypothetical protein SUGI_0872190 [Cryptomeria japonica]|nr:hypothetical protein SUGI_0872190 [Cryptomeria japonica]